MRQPTDEAVGELETVHTFDDGPMPTGVSVSRSGRVFVKPGPAAADGRR